jgi:peptide/nickel transport system permease protein
MSAPTSSLTKLFRILKDIASSPFGFLGLFLTLFWIFVAIFAPLLAPFSPTELIQPLVKPLSYTKNGQLLILGSDHIGRDVLSRIIHGTRPVLFWSIFATFPAYFIGSSLGLAAGYYKKSTDTILSFIANLILSFPVLVLYLIIIVYLGPSGSNIVVAITFASSPAIFRIVRALTLDIAGRDFINAAQIRGESSLYILFIEILPNAKGPLIVDFCLRVGYTAITIGVLGFLGLGLPPPSPDWGSMINSGRPFALFMPHMVIFPCIAISSFVLGLNLLADEINHINSRI